MGSTGRFCVFLFTIELYFHYFIIFYFQHLVGIPISYNVTLNCSIEIYPTSLNYWTRDNGSEHIVDSEKYKYVFFIYFFPDDRKFCFNVEITQFDLN